MRNFTLLALFLFTVAGLQAQTVSPVVVSSSGGEGTVGDVTVMWTLGEVAVTTLQSDNGYITQGFHQPPLGTTDVPYEVANVRSGQIHPNPATDRVTIETDAEYTGAADIELFRITGESVKRFSTRLVDGRTAVDTRDLATGLYLMRIAHGDVRYSAMLTVAR
jgi:hypothetical protein